MYCPLFGELEHFVGGMTWWAPLPLLTTPETTVPTNGTEKVSLMDSSNGADAS